MPGGDSLDLFAEAPAPRLRSGAPLAARMRPRSLDEVVGQPHLLGPGAPLRALAESPRLPSLVLWGPPGCGKTTIAGLLAASGPPPAPRFLPFSAVAVGVKEIRIHTGLEHRVLYLARFAEGIYVLHAFEKRTRKTPKRDIDLAQERFRALIGNRRTQRL